MAKYLKQPNKAQGSVAKLKRARRNVFLQAGLAVLTIVLTIVIVFSMTAAWYTNIVSTSGLMFQAQAWGFNGKVEVGDAPVIAAPGDEGVVHLVVTNDNENVTSLSVNVSKVRMDQQMSQRIYFYVDAQQTRNGENVDRIYLSNQDSFTYTLFSQGDLILTETMHNNAQLKWQWVYDVLGYYVLGKEVTDPVTGQQTVEIMEYLRPIEYDYDEATTTFSYDEEGKLIINLDTVDGTTSLEDFLVEFSKTDGYAGLIDPTVKTGDYFHVDVGQLYEGLPTGYGVYAYLCTYSEIEMATQYDTLLGQNAANGIYPDITARLTVSAQVRDTEIVTARSLADLKTAIASGDSDVIQLTDNITIPEGETLTLTNGQRVMVDLNGYDMICQNTDKAIHAQPGSALTLTNGNLTGLGAAEGDQTTSYAVYTVGAEVTMSQVNITGFQKGVYLADDQAENALDSRVRMVDCTLATTGNAITVMGNGLASAQTTQLVLEGCEITTDGFGIACNGTATGIGKWGTDIQVIDTTIACDPGTYNTGIYHPQKEGTLTVYNSTISAYTGICVKGGDVRVMGSTITGKGAKQDPVFWPSGFADTGDGIYVETNYYYPITLEISDSTIGSDYGYSLQVYDSNDADHVTVTVHSGKFQDELPGDYIAEGSSQTNTYEVVVDPVEEGSGETADDPAAQ